MEQVVISIITLLTVIGTALAQERKRKHDSAAVHKTERATTEILIATNGASASQLAEIKRLEGEVLALHKLIAAQKEADARHDAIHKAVSDALKMLPCAVTAASNPTALAEACKIERDKSEE
jgi:hypothetical protein